MSTDSAIGPDKSKVFIIYGRNLQARTAACLFLRSLKLEPVDFEDLAADLGGSAFIGDIVRAGMERAQGILALFTPDEIAFLAPRFIGDNDDAANRKRWQARPNVLFEAGMAFAMAPKRTILATMGDDVALFSDVGGVHILRLGNSAECRARFRQKLIGVGCEVDQRTTGWMGVDQAGDFDAAIRELPEVSARGPFR
jgi:predicted nucleotide-binding protein